MQGHEIKNTANIANITSAKKSIEAVHTANKANAPDYWLNKLTAKDNPYLVSKKSKIQQMITYSC